MEVITNEESYATARRIAKRGAFEKWRGAMHPEQQEVFFEEQVKKYFPEFEGFEYVYSALWGELFDHYPFKSRGGSGDGQKVTWIDIKLVSRHRSEIYAEEYQEFTDAVLDDVWEYLSRGAEAPGNKEELRRQARDLAELWDYGLNGTHGEWTWEIARKKTGGFDAYEKFGELSVIPILLDSYFAGVPVEYIIGE